MNEETRELVRNEDDLNRAGAKRDESPEVEYGEGHTSPTIKRSHSTIDPDLENLDVKTWEEDCLPGKPMIVGESTKFEVLDFPSLGDCSSKGIELRMNVKTQVSFLEYVH